MCDKIYEEYSGQIAKQEIIKCMKDKLIKKKKVHKWLISAHDDVKCYIDRDDEYIYCFVLLSNEGYNIGNQETEEESKKIDLLWEINYLYANDKCDVNRLKKMFGNIKEKVLQYCTPVEAQLYENLGFKYTGLGMYGVKEYQLDHSCETNEYKHADI